jgi:hypothetical protein
MRRLLPLVVGLVFVCAAQAQAYIEIPYTLGKVIEDSSHIVLIEVARVNKEKGLIIFKKVRDLKGEWPDKELKHNIGTRGFHEREWQAVMRWAEAGKPAIFFCQGDASETCLDGYWYQCYREEAWWGMSHGEPYLLRTFHGSPAKLADHVAAIQRGEQVVVTCLADGDREQLQIGRGKIQRLRASNTRLEYNVRRDFAGFGADGPEAEEYVFETILPASSPNWKYRAASQVTGENWMKAAFRDRDWTSGKAPLGYGEEVIEQREGTTLDLTGQDVMFRRTFTVTKEMLSKKDATFSLSVASDNNATIYLNGELLHEEPDADHEAMYWNHEVPIPRERLIAGKNLLAARVANGEASSDIFFDVELTTMYAGKSPKKVPSPESVTKSSVPPVVEKVEPDRRVSTLTVDAKARLLSLTCWIAPRKLKHLDEQYPIEVAATWPHPQGQKAHETIVVFGALKPSEIHAGLVKLGLKPGQVAIGEGAEAKGPEVDVLLEFKADNGKLVTLPLEKCLIHRESGKSPAPLQWRFTGSAMKQPDPEKDEQVYGADLTGTLLSLFPVTDACVLQTQLTMEDEPNYRLETNTEVLPAEGTEVRMILRPKSR